jgi:hypothetical protein
MKFKWHPDELEKASVGDGKAVFSLLSLDTGTCQYVVVMSSVNWYLAFLRRSRIFEM